MVQDTILNRTSDKMHRSFYRSLDREIKAYGKGHIQINPTLRHLIILLQKEQEGKSQDIKLINESILNPFKIHYLLEPIVFHCILALHYIQRRESYDRTYIEKQSKLQREYLVDVIQKTFNNQIDLNNLKLDIQEQLGVDIHSECLNLLSIIECSSSDVNLEVLDMALLCFSAISIKGYQQQYSIGRDLIPWINSIKDSNISEACSSLSNLTNIPPFILADILVRTPMSKNEFFLQLDIWRDYIKEISVYYHTKSRTLKLLLNNLIFYGVHFDSKKLPELLAKSLAFFTSTKSGFEFKFITKDYLNEVIWKVMYYCLSSSMSSSSKVENSIIKSQETVVQYLLKIGDKEEKLHKKLDLQGHMGLVLAIDKISPVKAKKLFIAAEKRFTFGNYDNRTKDFVAYNITKISLSATPEQLLSNFNNAAINYGNSAALWLSFIKKLNEFELLTEQRSEKILAELISNIDRVLITKDIILLLLAPVKNLSTMTKIIGILKNAKINLAKMHLSSLLPKYLALVYRSNSKMAKSLFPWKTAKSNTEFKNLFHSNIEYARYIYQNCITRKTSHIVGIMLNGEVNFQPANIYELYMKEFSEDSKLVPDSSCLAALMRASLKSNDKSCLMWGNFYAPQIAIHEFKQNVMSNEPHESDIYTERDTKIYPNDHLWQLYIKMLAKYDYISELSTILQWWELLKFNPARETLICLLTALPYEYSERHIKHIAKVKGESVKFIEGGENFHASIPNNIDWPWPTTEELNSYNINRKNDHLK